MTVAKRRYHMTARAAAAAHTRARILEAAYTLFTRQPFDEVTVPAIAKSAGVSVPTVFQHFGSKDRIVDALSESGREREAQLREVASGDPLEAARTICARYEDNGAVMIRMLAIEGRNASLDRALEGGRAMHRDWVERTFGPRLGRGAARRRRVMALVAAYDIYTWHVLRRTLDADETIHVMAELARGVLDKGAKP